MYYKIYDSTAEVLLLLLLYFLPVILPENLHSPENHFKAEQYTVSVE